MSAKPSIFDKLTDPKLYTGAHKHRFDDNGNGRGLAGRDRIAKGHGFIAGNSGNVNDLSQITRTHLHTSGAGTPSPRPASASRNTALRSSYSGAPSVSTGPGAGLAAFGAGTAPPPLVGRSSDAGQQRPTSRSGRGSSSGGGGSIFDRLHDPSSYTGMHRNRFSSDGRGRGAEGRTMANAYVSPMDNVRR
ncbi:hypothetical protein GPECTOR_38g253 [Gonium pectorale]|uniref:Uncharacterized protein n=1 Tax=Gonium pectorale TaxID=33097 RepID=A0A150GAZ3_GONPE|nr:hypothetical protein GPECTOR_38g253 [Gonium pectorale]|eukprot:KXZ47017.1 hypothetical protein GPECTOR_38g253 [Gonium pectorale]